VPVRVRLSETVGLSSADVEELQTLLDSKAAERADIGEVSVHQLAEECSEWLRQRGGRGTQVRTCAASTQQR
jgi:hypothetical protein